MESDNLDDIDVSLQHLKDLTQVTQGVAYLTIQSQSFIMYCRLLAVPRVPATTQGIEPPTAARCPVYPGRMFDQLRQDWFHVLSLSIWCHTDNHCRSDVLTAPVQLRTASATIIVRCTPPFLPEHHFFLSLQILIVQALEARLQQRGSELQQLSQVLSRHGTTHDEGPSHAGSSPSADGRAVATEQHGLSAAVHRHAYEVASVQPSSESNTAHTAFPTPATGAGAAWPPPGSLNNTAAAADEQEQDAWSEDSGSLEFDSSLLEMAGEQSTPYSLLTEVIEAAGSVPHQQTRRKAAIPVWRQQLQQELQQQHARQRQDAHIAATAGQQLHASQQEAVWRAMQGQLPFCTAGGKVPETKHKLQKSLDHMLGTSGSRAHFPAIAAEQPRTASEASQARARSPPGEQVNDLQAASMSEVTTAAPQQSTSSNSNPTKAKIVVPLLDRYIQTAAAQATLHNAQQPADVAPVSAGLFQHASLPVDTLSAQHTIGTPPARSIKAAAGGTSPSHRSSPKRKIPSKQNEWAAADAATNAELTAYLKEHWQQQYICAAALVLQCAWRSRGPRVNYNR